MEQFGQTGFDAMTRARILESKFNNLREKTLVINQNMVQSYKNLSVEIKLLNDDIKEVKNDMFEIKENMHKVIQEFKFFASKKDFMVLEKYINMWNPLNFVTEKEVEELIKKKRGGKSSTRSTKTRKKRK